MSLHDAAKHLASKGRNGDTLLLHVTPDEVEGIRALAHARGHELPINPETGLPEANFLSDVWKSFGPTILGAGLAATGIGAPLAALLVGGGYGLAEGSLEKGLMAGLDAFGGAGIGGGLTSLGASAAEAGASTAVNASAAAAEAGASNLASGTAAQLGADAGTQALGNSLTLGSTAAETAIPSVFDAGASAGANTGLTMADTFAPMAKAPTPLQVTPDPTFGENVSNMGKGIQALAKPGDYAGNYAEFSKATEAAAGVKPTTAGIAAAAPMMAVDPMSAPPTDPGYIRPYSYDPKTGTFTAGDAYRAGSESRIRPYDYDAGSGRFTAKDSRPAGYAAGGIAELSQGRFLRGGGDGVSDSIPAEIEGGRPARLADGEFVIPARIVSELGNGSSEAGARQLYAMMERVQNSRRKSAAPGRFADDTKASKHLPA